VLIPFGHSPDYDLVAEIHGELLRVQVKTSTFRSRTPNGDDRWSVSLATNGGNQSWTGRAKRFDPASVDVLFVLVGDGRRWLIPSIAIEGQAITLGGSKYSDLEITRSEPIDHLVYGGANPSLESRTSPGEYRSGQTGGAVNAMALSFAGSNPASPIARQSALPDGTSARTAPLKFQRTRISSAHQITIPSVPFRAAGLEVGDRLHATADGPGRVILERIEPPMTPRIGMTGERRRPGEGRRRRQGWAGKRRPWPLPGPR
jgi:bifunctional DNA-binding transcriptional regulator/antitoxin component of YhaV-PrlF toxin-antitoxin module